DQAVSTTSAKQTATFTNDKTGNVKLAAVPTLIGTNANQFAITASTCTAGKVLAPDDTCTTDVTFKPTSAGAKAARISLSSDAINAPETVPLSGTGTVHLARQPASLSFADQLVNTAGATQTATFTNDKQGNVTVSGASLTGAQADQFSISSTSCTAGTVLAPGQSCTADVAFQPTSAGAKSASLDVASNSTDSPAAVALSGAGLSPPDRSTSIASTTPVPDVVLDASEMAFGERIVEGGQTSRTLKLTSNGDTPLKITSVTLSGPHVADFELTSNKCDGQTLAKGASCEVQIGFLPSKTGLRTAVLTIFDNTVTSPHTIPLTGKGLPAPVLFKTANAEPVDGEVLVSLPVTARARALGVKGRTFIPLREARQVPLGSIFDTRKGRVRIATSTLTPTIPQLGQFYAGLFQLLQRRTERSVTEAKLTGGGSLADCTAKTGKTSARAAARKRLSNKALRTLRANAKGKFRTSGRYAAATVRGTIWSVTDRCDGTLTRVTRGTVVVRDFKARRNVIVRTGKSLLVSRR
ncbi:MAG: trimeric autotransporter adhesin, partial [Candidatus Binatota bacterium]|nr:trimeric autotransporter adhesin [Candidatus Binatota bacterium]